MTRCVLITGGMGYVGGRLAQALRGQAGLEIVLGSRAAQSPPAWAPEARVVALDWRSQESLMAACDQTDIVIHLAGMNDPECLTDPVAALEVNGVNSVRLLEAAKARAVKRFIYLSTAHVYGRPLAGVITETTCPLPLHSYATSHRAAEDAVRMEFHRGALEGIVLRLSNSFGPPAHSAANCWMLVVNDLCRQAVATGRMELMSSGLQRRDFIPLTDACRTIAHFLALSPETLEDGLFNVGGDWSPTVLEMAQRIADRVAVVMNKECRITRKPPRDGEQPEPLKYEIEKLLRTGFVPSGPRAVDEEIDALIRFCIMHPPA